MRRFRGCNPTARVLACLRIAASVTARGARLATSWAGYSFAGRVSHPLDNRQNFMKSSHLSFLSGQIRLVALILLSAQNLPNSEAMATAVETEIA